MSRELEIVVCLCEQCNDIEHHDWRVYSFFISIIWKHLHKMSTKMRTPDTPSSQHQLFFMLHCCSFAASNSHIDTRRWRNREKWLDDFDVVICRFCILFYFRCVFVCFFSFRIFHFMVWGALNHFFEVNHKKKMCAGTSYA